MNRKYKVITLCGDSQFMDCFQEEAKRLTLEGNLVLTPCLFDKDIPDVGSDFERKEMLFEIQKQRIDLSDMILVLNVNGEINEETKSQIAYAKSKAKGIRYLYDSFIENNEYVLDKFSLVTELPISKRLKNVFKYNHIDYLYQVEHYSEEYICRFRNFGQGALSELRAICDRYGVYIYSRKDLEIPGLPLHFSPRQYETMFEAGIKTKDDVVCMDNGTLAELFGEKSVIYNNLMQIKQYYKKQ